MVFFHLYFCDNTDTLFVSRVRLGIDTLGLYITFLIKLFLGLIGYEYFVAVDSHLVDFLMFVSVGIHGRHLLSGLINV